MTKLTIDTFQNAVDVLLPLPKKSHYLFNLRQVAEVVQGLLSVPLETLTFLDDKEGYLRRLWLHESLRVYQDRLIDEADKRQFIDDCLRFEANNFVKKDDIEASESIIFCNFFNANASEPVY